MRRRLYWIGRFLQITSLLAMPSAIWVSEFERSEKAALLIFGISLVLFGVGFFLTRLVWR